MKPSIASVKAVSFDLDDTLWSCAPAIVKADAALYRWYEDNAPAIAADNTPASLLDFQSKMRVANPHLQRCVTTLRLTGLRALLREYGYAEALAEEAFAVFYRARSEVELYAGAEDLLSSLQPHYQLAAITNGNADLDLIGLASYFDKIYAADMELAPKPEPDMFDRCIEDLNLPAHALLHIGDNPLTDVGGGYAAGVQTLWFNQYNEQWPEDLPRPHYEANTLSEVVELLAK